MSLETQKIAVTLTEKAASAVQEMFTERQLEGYALRVYVSNGGCGCSGPQYGLALEANHNPNDSVTNHFGVDLIVDHVSAPYLDGATIDYVDDPSGSGFKIENPNPVSDSSCGCGGGSCSC